MGRNTLPTKVPPALWHSISLVPNASLSDPNYVITGSPPSVIEGGIPQPFPPPQGIGALDWELLQAHVRIIVTERKMK